MSLIGRLKPLFVALLVTATLWTAPARAAGTIPLAMAQQIDINGQPLANCQVYFFVAGTPAQPQNAFADFSLTQSLGPQLSCDQAGRVPMFWLADGLVHVRLTDASGGGGTGGNAIIDTTMQVLGPSSGGGGGGGTVDPTTVISTGDLKAKYGTGPLIGFVRANGLTIGNATCGCSERANADTQALFVYLYTADINLAVSGGRTGNALNDFNANKQLTLPDWRGRALAFLDDMGNSPAGRLTASYFGTAATVLGAAGGAESQTLSLAQLPTGITSTVTGTQQYKLPAADPISMAIVLTGSGNEYVPYWHTSQTLSNNTITGTGTSNNTAGSAHPIASPMMLATIYVKL